MKSDDDNFNFHGQPPKLIRFFSGFISGLFLEIVFSLVIAFASMLFARTDFSFFDLAVLLIISVTCGIFSARKEPEKTDRSFVADWGVLAGMWAMGLVAMNVNRSYAFQGMVMGAGLTFGKWIEVQRMKRNEDS